MIKPDIGATWADQQLAALREKHPDWDFWHVPTYAGPTCGTFCAKPAAAMIATCHGDDPWDVDRDVADYEARLDEHLADARAELHTPGLHDDRRNVLERQIVGMTRLRSRSQAAPARHVPA